MQRSQQETKQIQDTDPELDDVEPQQIQGVDPKKIEDLLANAAQPVMVRFKNSQLAAYFRAASSNCTSPIYFDLGLYIFLDKPRRSSWLISVAEEWCSKKNRIQIFDLKKSIWLDLTFQDAEDLHACFKTSNNELVLLDVDKIIIADFIRTANDIYINKKRKIKLPDLLSQHLKANLQELHSSLSIQLFPDSKHLGILDANTDFYRIDLVTGEIIKFELRKDKDYKEQTKGFIPYSADEIAIWSTSEWRRITLDETTKAWSNNNNLVPLKSPLDLIFHDNGTKDYQYCFLDKILVNYEIGLSNAGRLKIWSPNNFRLYDGHAITAYHPNLNRLFVRTYPTENIATFSVSEATLPGNGLEIMEFQKEDESHKSYRHDIETLLPCSEQAVLTANSNGIMTAYFFPVKSDSVTKSEIYGVLDKLHLPSVLNQIIASYTIDPTPDVLRAPCTTILSYSIFQPKSFKFEPDLKQLNNLEDVQTCFSKFVEAAEKAKPNIYSAQEAEALQFLAKKIKILISCLVINKNGSIDLFRDYHFLGLKCPSRFMTDFLCSITKPDNKWEEYTCKVLMPILIRKHQLDKVLEKTQEIINEIYKNKEKSEPGCLSKAISFISKSFR